MRVARMQPSAQLRVTRADRNANALFNAYFNQQLIGTKPLLYFVVWTESMRIGCKLNVNWMQIDQFSLQTGSNPVQVQTQL